MTAGGPFAGLDGTRFGDVWWVESTGSTNDDALQLARSGAPEGVVVVADEQTAGKGRLGRSWQAPPGSSLLASVLLRPSLAAGDVYAVVSATALSAAEACAAVCRVRAGVKWPNDLVVATPAGDRKLGGILAESVAGGGRIEAVVVGIGLNVNWPVPLPPDLAGIATSLDALAGREVDRERLLVALLRRLDSRYGDLGQGGGLERLRADYRARCVTIGREVRVEQSQSTWEGVARDVTAEGHLVVDAGGQIRTISAADVIHLR